MSIHVILKDSNINIYRYRQIVVGHYVKATEGFENVKSYMQYGALKLHVFKQDGSQNLTVNDCDMSVSIPSLKSIRLW